VTRRRPSGRKVIAQGSANCATGVATNASAGRVEVAVLPLLQATLSIAAHANAARENGDIPHFLFRKAEDEVCALRSGR
jgi:hypothetical protein